MGVDTALVGEGHLTDDGLVCRKRHAGEPGDVGREGIELLGHDPGIDPVEHLKCHHQFLEGSVSRPLTEAAYGDVSSGRSGAEGGDRVCERKTEIVMAVDGERGKEERRDEFGGPLGREEPDGVAEAEPVCASFDPLLKDRREERLIGAGCILAGEFDDETAIFRVLDSVPGHITDLRAGLSELRRYVEVTYRNDEVDRVCPGVCGKVDIHRKCPDIRATLCGEPGIGDCADRFALTFRCGRRAGLYDMDADVGKMCCDLKFRGRREGDARCLFAVP